MAARRRPSRLAPSCRLLSPRPASDLRLNPQPSAPRSFTLLTNNCVQTRDCGLELGGVVLLLWRHWFKSNIGKPVGECRTCTTLFCYLRNFLGDIQTFIFVCKNDKTNRTFALCYRWVSVYVRCSASYNFALQYLNPNTAKHYCFTVEWLKLR